MLAVVAFVVSGGPAAGVGGGSAVRSAAGDFRVLTVDSSDFPLVESMVVVPRALSGRTLSSESFEVHQAGANHPVEAVPLDPQRLELVLMVDDSVGGGEVFQRAQGALLELPVHLPQARVAVVHSGRPATRIWPLAADPDTASLAVRSLRPMDSGALEVGVDSALRVFPSETPQDGTSRAVVMIVGDADVDPYRIVSAALTARELGVTFYVITVAESVRVDFDRLASMTNGRAVAVDADNLVAAVDRTMADLRGQYRLRFDLSGRPEASDLQPRLPGEVVAAVGIRPVAATVNADGVSADLRLAITPPSPVGTGAAAAPARAVVAAAGHGRVGVGRGCRPARRPRRACDRPDRIAHRRRPPPHARAGPADPPERGPAGRPGR